MQNFNKEDFEGYVSKKTLFEQDFQDYSNTDVLCAIKDCPTEDVESVIHCKNCKRLEFSDFYGECNLHCRIVRPDDYCSWAVRKDEQ